MKPISAQFDSTAVAAMVRSPDTQIMGVNFVTGGPTYLFADVPYKIAEDWTLAESAGRYYNQYIRGKYQMREAA